jgi:competence CoiA-like predicted nuclease
MVTEAEVKKGGAWAVIDFAEALNRKGLPMRCPACHGPVSTYNGGGAVPHFYHRTRHEHCPQYSRFSGDAKPHPDALA